MTEKVRLADALVNAICELAKVNRITGIWDNKRFQECKKPFDEVDCAYLYKTEKLSRKNVELRAVHRTAIDSLFEQLLLVHGRRNGPPNLKTRREGQDA